MVLHYVFKIALAWESRSLLVLFVIFLHIVEIKVLSAAQTGCSDTSFEICQKLYAWVRVSEVPNIRV